MLKELLLKIATRLGLVDLWVGLRVMFERFKEEMSPFPPEPWRRG